MASGVAEAAESDRSRAVRRSEETSSSAAWWLTWLSVKLATERVAVGVVLAIGFLLFIPALGSVGLWDPWETHYGEVARAMIARDDYVYPYWESAYFFSKPALPMWLMALGLWIVGAENPAAPDAPLGPYTEWGMRVPFALTAILAMWGVYRIGRVLKDRTTGVLAAFVLATCAQFIFVGKQAMVDMPFVGFMTAGLALFVSAVFDREEDAPASRNLKIATIAGLLLALAPQLIFIGREMRDVRGIAAVAGAGVLGLLFLVALALRGTRRECWLAGFYIFMGLSVLSKGLAPLAVVGPAVLLYAILANDLDVLFRARVVSGGLLFLLIAAPWYVTMHFFPGRDDEGKTFDDRFWGHDNFGRVGTGVHGERGGLGFFIEQIAYGTFPWVAVIPAALGFTARQADEGADVTRKRTALFVLLWGVGAYVFFSFSLTKFHHYILPALPALAVLVGYWVSYVAERPDDRIGTFPAILIAALLAVATRDLVTEPQHLVNLFTYKYDREYPRDVQPWRFMVPIFAAGLVATVACWTPKGVLRVLTLPATILAGLFGPKLARLLRLDAVWKAIDRAPLRPSRDWAILSFGVMAGVFGLWISHHHFNMLSPHWSQAHLFETYYDERVGSEPIYAYQLNWRGETFYSRNRVLQVKEAGANERMRQLVDRPGREFIITEQSRYHTLQGILSPDKRDKIHILDRSNNKFYLCVVDE